MWTATELLAILAPQIAAAAANPGLRSLTLPDGTRYDYGSLRSMLADYQEVKAAATAESTGSNPNFRLAGLRGGL